MSSDTGALQELANLDCDSFLAIDAAVAALRRAGIATRQQDVSVTREVSGYRVFFADAAGDRSVCSAVVDVAAGDFSSSVTSAPAAAPCPEADSPTTLSETEYLALRAALELGRSKGKALRFKWLTLVREGGTLIALLSAADRAPGAPPPLGGPGIEVLINASDLSIQGWSFAR